MKIGIIYHKDFTKYGFGPGHPLRCKEWLDDTIAFSMLKNNKRLLEKAEIEFIEPYPATEKDILTVHTEEYIDFIKCLNEKGGFITPDTPVLKGVYEIAKLFAGADMLAGKLVMEKKLNKSLVFGAMGHHVGVDFGGGFGIVNDIAVMIETLRENYGLKKIVVFDYAANAGHGTANIYYETSDVLCIDTHQDPLNLYPGTGFIEQVGRGEGRGYTVNIPLPPFTRDEDYRLVLHSIIVPIVAEYKPEIIILVGLNGCHFTVKENQLMKTLSGLKEVVNVLSRLSDEICEGRLVHLGGFSQDVKLLPLGFLATVAGVLDVDVELPEPYDMPVDIPDVTENVEGVIQEIRDVHEKYWRCLKLQ